jgi:hypothetical protein
MQSARAAVVQRVVLYEEDPADPQGKRFVGSAIWRTETISPGPGRSPELAIRADIEIPSVATLGFGHHAVRASPIPSCPRLIATAALLPRVARRIRPACCDCAGRWRDLCPGCHRGGAAELSQRPAWIAAFGGFVVLYAPILFRRATPP